MTYTAGQRYYGFTLEEHQRIEEIKADVYLFRHDYLGCPVFAIKNDDPNKTFTVAFNTIPTDSTGVAHILEHSVLMGSKKYPIKDVFGEINKGGLTTFLNAMTGSDITYYPFATRNLKEYFNIMDVYCDVVFNPLLLRSTFEQEGWHYHKESPQSPLLYQGVVYNEMKGAFSDPIRLIFHHIFGGLMPDSTYAHESGGDPRDIPDLTYEQFVEFHKHHYHPSNSTFFFYGDADLNMELDFLQERFLRQYDTREERREIKEGNPASTVTFIEDSYGVESKDIQDRTFIAVGSMVSTVQNRLQNTAFQIIANILFNSDGSPLKKAIISSGLCKDFGGFYLSTSCFRTFMITYLVGCEAEKRDAFLQLYNSTLASMAAEGLERDLILSELNKYEFSAREESSKSQRGLDLIGKAMAAFKYNTSPFENLVSEELIRNVRHKALEEDYFEQLIKEYLLSNESTVVVTLKPDPQKGQVTYEEEKARLEKYAQTLDTQKEEQLIARTEELMNLQLRPNDEKTLAGLPRLEIADLPTSVDFHAVNPSEISGCPVLISELLTNHITYIDLGFDFKAVPARLLPWLDVFGTIITEIGTRKMNFMQFAKEVATCTGNLSHSLNVYMRKDAPDELRPIFWLQTKCLPAYLERTIQLLHSVLRELSLEDRTRIKEIVRREFAWAEHSAQSEGYNLPTTRVFAHLSVAGYYNELIHGVTAYQELKKLATEYDRYEHHFLQDLEELSRLLFNRNNLILGIAGEEEEVSVFSNEIGHLVESLPTVSLEPARFETASFADHEAFITSAEIVFAVQGGNLLPQGKDYNGHFEVLKTYLSRDFLWNSVRQMGGAYGCFVQFSNITGNLAFVSYRDPQVKKTYQAYSKVPQIVADLELPDNVLQQLIIGTYGNFDPHQSPAAKAATARNEFLSGITSEFKQQRLKEITATTLEDLRAFAPAFAEMMPKSYRAIIGNRAKIENDKDLFTTLTEL
ncbi:MAG: insulinase family protein [Desulfopila sp.]|jgi:Zn-dependent M16 (insulinase) family peptidase|nr:insulinase family protein [Desulfopila sp.]